MIYIFHGHGAWAMGIHHRKTFSFQMTHWAGNPLNWYWSDLKSEIQFKSGEDYSECHLTMNNFTIFLHILFLIASQQCEMQHWMARQVNRTRMNNRTKKIKNFKTWIGSHSEWEKELQFPFQITFLGIRVLSRMIVYSVLCIMHNIQCESAYIVSLRPLFNYFTF